MKALILAAGLGSRLKHKTSDRPKALTLVAGKPILQWQIEALLENGVKDFCVVLGYKGELIQDFFSKSFYQNIKIEFVWNKLYDSSNSSYSFWLAKDHIQQESYLHVNCDILFSAQVLKELVTDPRDNVIAIRKDIKLADQMENVALEGDRITAMSIKNTPESVAKAYGLAKLGSQSTDFLIKRIEHYLQLGDKNQNCYGIIREAVKEMDYYSYNATNKLLHEVNTLEDLDRAESALSAL